MAASSKPTTPLPALNFWSGSPNPHPSPPLGKAVPLPLIYSRSNCPAFSISEVLRCAQDLGGGLKRPPIASTWKGCDSTTELLPLKLSRLLNLSGPSLRSGSRRPAPTPANRLDFESAASTTELLPPALPLH